MAYVGTYSSPALPAPPGKFDLPRGNGRGIHLFQVNRATGLLTPAGIHEMGTSPSCLAINAAGTRMYSTNATDSFAGTESGSIGAFSIDRTDGSLTLLNAVASGGKGPTYVSIHPAGRHVLVANYPGSSVAVLPILPDGRLGSASDVQRQTGTVGPPRATHAPPGSFAISGHDTPHAHMILADASGRHVIAADLGLDQLLIWKFDERAGKLFPNATTALPPGDGPRHFHFHPNGRWFYSLQEEGSTVVFYDYDTDQGRLTERQTLASLPDGFAGTAFASEILVSPDGRFVYAANRLHDSIAHFAVGRDGRLTRAGETWTRGDYPRSFSFDPTGAFFYSLNQRSDAVTTFRVNRRTGALAFTGQYTPVGNPSHMVFLDLGKTA